MTSHCRAALQAAGLPLDPRDNPHFRQFWYVPPRAAFIAPQRHRFTDAQVREIRRRRRRGEKAVDLAALYNVAPWTIHRMTNGHTYTHVAEEAA